MRVGRRKVWATVLMFSVTAAPGCSLFQSKMQPLTIIPSDSRAEISINGTVVGKGTVTREVERGKSYTVMAKIGNRAGTAQVSRKISGTGIADIIGGLIFLVPFIGCFAPGFWDLDPSTVSVALPPPPAASAEK